jgi:hypothetical protein
LWQISFECIQMQNERESKKETDEQKKQLAVL